CSPSPVRLTQQGGRGAPRRGLTAPQCPAPWPTLTSDRLLQNLAELALDPRRLGLDVIVVDWDGLDRAQRRIAFGASDVDACRIEMLLREQRLHILAQHEIGESLGRVRMR